MKDTKNTDTASADTVTVSGPLLTAGDLPAVTQGDVKALAEYVASNHATYDAKAGHYVLTTKQAKAAEVALLVQGIGRPRIIKTLAAMKADGVTLFAAVSAIKNKINVFRSEAAQADYVASVKERASDIVTGADYLAKLA